MFPRFQPFVPLVVALLSLRLLAAGASLNADESDPLTISTESRELLLLLLCKVQEPFSEVSVSEGQHKFLAHASGYF